MPKQTHIFTYTGKIGNTIGFKLKGKYFLRSMPEEVRRSPASCLAANDFGTACKHAKVIRHALPDLPKDHTRVNRLNKVMIKVVNADKTRPKGYKHILPANLAKLKGFSFNKGKSIHVMYAIDKDHQGNIRIQGLMPGIKAIALTMNGVSKTSEELINGNTLIIPDSEVFEPVFVILQQGAATDIIEVLLPTPFLAKVKVKKPNTFKRTWTLSPHHRYSFRIPRYISKSSPPIQE